MPADDRPNEAAPWRLCVAPMMAWTDRHCRMLHRIAAPRARLYTEMVTTGALKHGDWRRALGFDPAERPLALQVGGSDPADLAHAARLAAGAGFDEVNLNAGCPSERVRRGAFGACLMREPARVAAGIRAMKDACSLPVTVKCRIGVDGEDRYGFLRDFVGAAADAGARTFIVHARIAVLTGLTPAQNRSVPPLKQGRVRRLAREFPELAIVINGGIADIAEAARHLGWAAGVMVGRAAYRNPVWLGRLHAELFGSHAPTEAPTANDIAAAYLPYVERSLAGGVRLHDITRHMLGLFAGAPGARRYRRALSEPGGRGDSLRPLLEALAHVGRGIPAPRAA